MTAQAQSALAEKKKTEKENQVQPTIVKEEKHTKAKPSEKAKPVKVRNYTTFGLTALALHKPLELTRTLLY